MAFETDIFGNCDKLFTCAATWSNDVTDGVFWSLILISFAIVLFMATFRFGTNRAFGFAGIGMIFIAIPMKLIGLIPTWILTISAIVGALGIVFMRVGER